MTLFTVGVSDPRQRRIRVEGNRVACWRLGPVELDRCRECLYLVTLDNAAAPDAPMGYVVCVDSDLDAEVDFAW